MGDTGDSVLRAMTNDGGFRVMTALSTQTASDAVKAQSAKGDTAVLLANLVTGCILVRETMSPNQRVQAILVSPDRKWQLVADSHPDGSARSLVRVKEGDTPDLSQGGLLQLMRSLPNGDLHRGMIEVPPRATVSDMLTVYMKTSEQSDSTVSVGCLTDNGEITAAAGYIVQLLPELEEGPHMVMQERLKDFKDMSKILEGTPPTPTELTNEILYAMEYTKLSESPIRFGCNCSTVRVMTSLATLPKDDIRDLISSGEGLELSCDYCNKSYGIGIEQLKGFLDEV